MSMAVASPPHLLVVEDDHEILDVVQGVLHEEGYAVTPATSLPASLVALEEHLFHLVLTDLFLQPPQSHPFKSIQPLLTEAAPIPVGVMTAWRVSEDDTAQANLAFLLRKPFELDDLLRHLDANLHPSVSSARQHQMVEQFFLALNAHDWQRLARLCISQVRMVPLHAPALAPARSGLLSLQTTLEQRVRALPGYTIEGVQVFPRPIGVSARYIVRWQGRDGIVHRTAGAMHFRFQHGRIAQIDGAF